LLDAAKTSTAEFAVTSGHWPADASISEVVGTTTGKYVTSITSSGGGTTPDNTYTLTALLASTNISAKVANKTIQLQTTDGGANWVCGGSLGDLQNQYRPAACR
jgi:hypothetical protein